MKYILIVILFLPILLNAQSRVYHTTSVKIGVWDNSEGTVNYTYQRKMYKTVIINKRESYVKIISTEYGNNTFKINDYKTDGNTDRVSITLECIDDQNDSCRVLIFLYPLTQTASITIAYAKGAVLKYEMIPDN